jgi:hypothetical protein
MERRSIAEARVDSVRERVRPPATHVSVPPASGSPKAHHKTSPHDLLKSVDALLKPVGGALTARPSAAPTTAQSFIGRAVRSCSQRIIVATFHRVTVWWSTVCSKRGHASYPHVFSTISCPTGCGG